MKQLKIYLFFALLAFLEACSFLGGDYRDDFIKTNGGQFVLHNKPYYFVGANFWYGCYLGAPGESGNRERLISELDNLKELGVTNLRILGASEQSDISASLSPALQTELGVYNERLLEGLDFLLSEMRKRNMYAVIFLNNYWEWSGGMGRYVSWADSVENLNPAETEWEKYNAYINSFYRNKEANKYFRQYIRMLIERENKFTGDKYFEDPTIMAWELANEPRPGFGKDGEKYFNMFYKWIDETAGFIKSIDPYHLVATGSEGEIGCLKNPEYFIKIHRNKNIDYATFHLWAKNWGWFDPENIKETYPTARVKAIDYITKHIGYAKRLNKPIVLEEFGLDRDGKNYLPGTPTTARDDYYKMILNLVFVNAAKGGYIGGSNFWAWGGSSRAKGGNFIWSPGDEFTGDPPHEPQGLNSVFNTDKRTISLIEKFAGKMNELNRKKLLIAE